MDLDKVIPICIICNKENIPFYSDNNTSDIYNKEFLASDTIKKLFNGINDLNNEILLNNNDDSDDDYDLSPIIDCKYFDLISFKIFEEDKKKFSTIHLNIASLSLHKEELEAVLNILDFKFDVIGISETKIKKGIIPDYKVTIDGYQQYSTPTESDKGGVILYISKKYFCKPRKDLDKILYKSYALESIFVEIILTNKKNILLGCIYRHPSMEVSDFNENYLIPFMDKIEVNKNIFLLGDFNIDLMNNDVDTHIATYLDTLTSNLFVPHIIHPTRITSHSRTLIDNIFSNFSNFAQGKSGNLTLSISDHLAQFLIIPLDLGFVPRKSNIYKRDLKHFDRVTFLEEINHIDWPTILKLENGDPNLSFNNFYSAISTIIDKYIPMRKRSRKEIKHQSKPWITKEILNSIKSREKNYKKFIKAKDEQIKEEFHIRYKELRNKVLNMCRVSKKAYFQKKILTNIDNVKNIWNGIKLLININNNSKTQPTSILVKNELISDPKKVADEFNTYFSTIASNLQDKIKYFGKDFSIYLKNSNINNLFISPTDKHEIIKIIDNININKASGPYSIPTEILHEIKLSIAEPLADIINLSFEKGVYIEKLKMSKVIPIFKEKGSHLDCNNYRPISLLSNLNKIVEKLMHQRLYAFLLRNDVIYNLQFGFRSGHSTDHALLHLTDDIRNALDHNQFAVGVFIDLQKAFDTVDHKILIKKLEHYGIRGIANNWFKSYLSNRKQTVTINQINSDFQHNKHGVPQGSVLGPLLFLIYINDLHSTIKHCSTRHFADDTNLLIKNKSIKQLQKHLNFDLRRLVYWLKSNKISLNTSKSEMLIFRHPNKVINYDLKIKLQGKRLYPSKYVKYLGILIDPHLNWSFHTDILASKLSRTVGMLSKIRHFVSNVTLRNIYFGIFSSILMYGAQIWGQVQNRHVNRIIRLQNKAIRIINFANYQEPTSNLFNNSKILKFEDNIALKNYLYVHDSFQGKVPAVLTNNFEYLHEYHNHNTRISTLSCVKLPKARTQAYGISSVIGQSARSWNYFQVNCSGDKLHLKSKSLCKKQIKKFLLNKYIK